MKSPFKETLTEHTGGTPSRFYNTALVQDIPDLTLATIHKVRYGDRFDNLAFLYYRTPTLWWIIAKANGFTDGSMTAPVGTSIYIPQL